MKAWVEANVGGDECLPGTKEHRPEVIDVFIPSVFGNDVAQRPLDIGLEALTDEQPLVLPR